MREEVVKAVAGAILRADQENDDLLAQLSDFPEEEATRFARAAIAAYESTRATLIERQAALIGEAFRAGHERGASLGRSTDPISGETIEQAFKAWRNRQDRAALAKLEGTKL